MREIPTLFNGPMVRAILAGTKTQTRRVLKQATGLSLSVGMDDDDLGVAELSWLYGDGPGYEVHEAVKRVSCPYGQPGDRLWVRETWLEDPEDDGTWAYTQFMGCKGSPLSDIPERFQKPEHCLYRADWTGPNLVWRPSIHMPRWASRILLEVTAVRVERLQDISASDCWAEGIPHSPDVDPTHEFQDLWSSVNGADSWAANPWVWVVEFWRIK